MPKGDSISKLRSLLRMRQEESVLIDAGGIFCDLSQEAIAEEILALRPNMKGVLLFDEEGNEW